MIASNFPSDTVMKRPGYDENNTCFDYNASKLTPGDETNDTADASPRWELDEIGPVSDSISGIFDSHHTLKYDLINTNSSLDDINYSVAWFHYHKQREKLFRPYFMSFGVCHWERLRLSAIALYWRTSVSHKINHSTIHLAIWIAGRLFHSRRSFLMTRVWFAGVTVSSFRIALKFEERPDSMWALGRIWEVFPIFNDWDIDRTDTYLLKVEAESLRLLDDIVDVPLGMQFFNRYVRIGGWPRDCEEHYSALGHYLLALATFASGDKFVYLNVGPSMLGAAIAVLTVKIINGDHRCGTYEFYPERLAAYCQLSLKELNPLIRLLSSLLRSKPPESAILSHVFETWGKQEWK